MNTSKTDIQNQVICDQVKNVLNKLLKAQGEGDIESFSACFAHDENLVYIGTDLDELWYNWETFHHWMENEIDKWKGYTINQKNTLISHSSDGHIAWYSQLIDSCPETKGEVFRLEGFRHTGVMENRDGKWTIVQSHVSIPYTPSDTLIN